MRVEFLKVLGTWRDVANSARTTIGEEAGFGIVSSSWKRRMLLSEHSPIRRLHISWKWTGLMYWISTHFVRHKYGIEHYVKTQRTDRTGDNRNLIPQGALVDHECDGTPQSIIYISRKRLCAQASDETRDAWKHVLAHILTTAHERELFDVCVPDCIYRGWCYEYKSCGYHLTPEYQEALEKYRGGINQWK